MPPGIVTGRYFIALPTPREMNPEPVNGYKIANMRKRPFTSNYHRIKTGAKA